MNREVRGPEGTSAPLRASSNGDPAGVAVCLLVLLIISPVAFLVAIGTTLAIVRQVHRHWWEIAIAAGACLLGVAVIEHFVFGGIGAFHYGGYLEAIAGERSWVSAICRSALLGIPAGIV